MTFSQPPSRLHRSLPPSLRAFCPLKLLPRCFLLNHRLGQRWRLRELVQPPCLHSYRLPPKATRPRRLVTTHRLRRLQSAKDRANTHQLRPTKISLRLPPQAEAINRHKLTNLFHPRTQTKQRCRRGYATRHFPAASFLGHRRLRNRPLKMHPQPPPRARPALLPLHPRKSRHFKPFPWCSSPPRCLCRAWLLKSCPSHKLMWY